jgi:hypothetical protein
MEKYKILAVPVLLIINSVLAQAQFTSGPKFFIGGGGSTTVSIDGLVIKPNFDFELNDKTMTLSGTPISGSPKNSIERVYSFDKEVTFTSGLVGIVYQTSELNGNLEPDLQIAYLNQQEGFVTSAGSEHDLVSHFVSKPLFFTSFSKLTAVSAKSALPVTLVSFYAEKSESDANLLWSTTMEANSDFFEVQRSFNGKVWETLGKVESSKESRVLTNYSFTDPNPKQGENLYRLKMVDADGTYAFSKIISLKFDNGFRANFYPNPVTDILQIQAEDWTDIKNVDFFNSNGTRMKVSSPSGYTDSQLREFNLSGFPRGSYVVKITNLNGQVSVSKVVKL